jgi:alkylation response protein AidB-like acyl-CoA dehydrogenase
LATRAVRDGDEWVVNGQKVWTSVAHHARFAILVARTDPDLPKHAGLTYFLCDMTASGVEVRPLRQITGEAEFNEVFLTDVRIPDAYRLGAEGKGWRVATTTLNNERVSIGGQAAPRESGVVGAVTRAWREHPQNRTAELHDRLMRLWVHAEVGRITAARLRQKLAAGQPGPGLTTGWGAPGRPGGQGRRADRGGQLRPDRRRRAALDGMLSCSVLN